MFLTVGRIYDAWWCGQIREIVITRIRLRADGAALIDIRISHRRRLGPKLFWAFSSWQSLSNAGEFIVQAIDDATEFKEEGARETARWREVDSVRDEHR